MKKQKTSSAFYITTTIPYVNADPHIGFALELVQADALARHQRLLRKDVFFSTGTDEYGQKIWEASQKEGKDIQDYVDYYAQKFLDLKGILNLSYDNFIRTTSPGHIVAAQEFWHLCDKKGDIYKKIYRGLYCVGCERFITEKDLMDGLCSLHPNQKPEMVEEENYFFRLSSYKKQLLEYLSNEKAIIPEWRRKEAMDYVQDGMEDFSISRDKRRFSWGIPIPGDDTQVMYVWFGAFINYISTLGWPNSKGNFEKFWQDGETVQIAGKDMVKFQSVMWQGMLMSAGMPTTDTIAYHGFITGEGGIKMSKSIGNVVNPEDIVKEYGTDALRYFLLREISPFEDSPFTMERFKESYNANLANGLGNLVSRIMTLSQKHIQKRVVELILIDAKARGIDKFTTDAFDRFDIKMVCDMVWNSISKLDKKIANDESFKLFNSNSSIEEAKNLFAYEEKIIEKKDGKEIEIKKWIGYLWDLAVIAYDLEPILPETSKKIREIMGENKKPEQPLFLRKD